MTSLQSLQGAYKGVDVFVCGTGTSLAGFDWTRLNAFTTIALNDAIHAKGFKPTFHLWADAGLYARYIRSYPETQAVVPEATAHLVQGAYADVVTYTHVKRYDRRRAKVCDPRWPAPHGTLIMPSPAVDNASELFCNHTVATCGIQLAWKLGAARIFLVGCDAYTYEPNGGGNYFDGRRAQAKHIQPIALGDGRYRTNGHIFWDMEMWTLREWFAQSGHHIGPWPDEGVYNCSVLSTLTAWQKVTLEEAIDAQGGKTWSQHSQLQDVMRQPMPSLR